MVKKCKKKYNISELFVKLKNKYSIIKGDNTADLQFGLQNEEERKMINSSEFKLALCHWLYDNYNDSFRNSLKLQKFLFLYNAMCKTMGCNYDFSKLRGYKNGTVYSDVYGDYTKEKDDFVIKVKNTPYADSSIINNNIALRAGFLTDILNEKDLSELTHSYNIWKSKEKRIIQGKLQVSLEDEDFSKEDTELTKELISAYSLDDINNSETIKINQKIFLFFNKEDIKRITEEQMAVLSELSEDDDLINPVYITVAEDGVLEID